MATEIRRMGTFLCVHREAISTLEFAPSGELLLSNGQEWSHEEDEVIGRAAMTALDGTTVASYLDLDVTCRGALSPSGKVVALPTFEGLLLLRAGDLSVLRRLSPGGSDAGPLRFTHDGEYLAAFSRNPDNDDYKILWLYRTSDWKAEAVYNRAPCATWLVASRGGRLGIADVRARVLVWDVALGRPVFDQVVPPKGQRWWTKLAFCAEGTELLTGADLRQSLHLWDIASGKCITRLDYEPPVSAVTPFDEASLVFVGDEGGDIVLFDVHRGCILAQAETGAGEQLKFNIQTDEKWTVPVEKSAVTSLAVSPDRRRLAAGDMAGSIHLYEIHGLA